MIRNIGSNAAASLFRAATQFALSLVLTRFVAPKDYAIIAMISPISVFVLMIGDFGLTSAIVRAPNVSRGDLGAAAKICSVAGAAVFAVTALLFALGVFRHAPPQFGGIALAFSIIVLLSMVVIVPRASLERRLQYQRITVIETAGTALGFLVACGTAFAGAGVWSFVFFYLTVQASRAVAMWATQARHIDLGGAWRGATPLMGFGGWLLASNLVSYVARNADNYIVAAILGAESLGLYALAYQVMLVPIQALTWPISGVLLATLSRLHDQPEMRARAFLATVGLTALASIPVAAFLVLKAPVLFNALLSPKWHAVGPLAARMAVAGSLQSITAFNGILFTTQGKLRAQLLLAIASTSIVLLTVAIAAWSGGTVLAVVDAYLGFAAISTVVYFYIMGRMLGTGMAPLARTLTGAILVCGGGAAAMFALLAIVPHEAGGKLDALLSLAGYGAGALVVIALWLPQAREALGTLQKAGRDGAARVRAMAAA